jgi:hypothetical protein
MAPTMVNCPPPRYYHYQNPAGGLPLVYANATGKGYGVG